MKLTLVLISFLLIVPIIHSQTDGINKNSSQFKIARLKYSGGGDWYNDPSAEINMMDYLKKNTTIDVDESKFYSVDVASDDIFNYPFVLITGHGNIEFSASEAERLRKYCESGGFLYADDDYGMNDSFRREMKKVFPEDELKELPFDHKIYNSQYNFPNGLPKIHEHDQKPRRIWIYKNGRLCFIILMRLILDGWLTQRNIRIHREKEEVFKMWTTLCLFTDELNKLWILLKTTDIFKDLNLHGIKRAVKISKRVFR